MRTPKAGMLVGLVVRTVAGLAQNPPASPPGASDAAATVQDTTLQVVTQASAAIDTTAVARHLAVLAADSMHQRTTPSPGLDRTAQYLATEFHRLGLQPGDREGPAAAWVQRYALPGQQLLDLKRSAGLLMMGLKGAAGKDVLGESSTEPLLKQVTLDFTTTTYFAPEVGQPVIAPVSFNLFGADEPLALSKPLVVVSGRHTVTSVQRAADRLRDAPVFYIPAAEVDSALQRQIVAELYAMSQRVLMVSGDDSARFAAALRTAGRQPVTVVDHYIRYATGTRSWPWAVWVRTDVMRAILATAGLDLAQLQADSTPVVRQLPSTAVWFNLQTAPRPGAITAPNVMALLEGSDPALKGEYVVLSAHMDNGDPNPAVTDSLTPRVDDNAAGIAALLAVARAFTQPGVRPRRSVLFLATSGGTNELWGANAFVDSRAGKPIVADLNLDRLDEVAGDSLWVDGLREVHLPMAPAWVTAANLELGLAVADGGTVIAPTSDHFAFVRGAVPSLWFHTTSPEAVVKPATPRAIDAAQTVRIARLVFYVGQQIATARRAPRWTSTARQQLQPLLGVAP